MNAPLDVVPKRFDVPDETRIFNKGQFEVVHLGGVTIGRATYEPGWRWSLHVGAKLGQAMREVEHVGMVVSGSSCATVAVKGSAPSPRRSTRAVSHRLGPVSGARARGLRPRSSPFSAVPGTSASSSGTGWRRRTERGRKFASSAGRMRSFASKLPISES